MRLQRMGHPALARRLDLRDMGTRRFASSASDAVMRYAIVFAKE
jgi:hypothetical protein